MPDDRSNINPMQANLGLFTSGNPVGAMTPTPADTALMLTQQATARQQHSQQMSQLAGGAGSPVGAAAVFGQQFQQRLQTIQQQQGMSPYAAQMIAQQMPGMPQYGAGTLPSPLMMTPAATGAFRPPMQPPSFAPVPPMHVPRQQWSPFTPQMPQPMFRTPYEQMAQAEDIRADRGAAFVSQLPRFGAQAAAFGGGAWAGRRLAQRFGMRGRMGMVGMAAGALAVGASGIAEGLGNIADYSMMPFRERRQMGAGMQRMSRDWVVTGPQLHATGRGLTREAGIEFGGAVREMAADEGFQQQTGGMFNRQDLMQITRQGGRAGLFDMAQSVPQIRDQLRTTAVTIRQFMELTNDPDVTNVIRQMGRMRQFGMTQQEMVTAAQGMRTFARAAGTTVQGVQQMGGMPGAMTFQQAGLTPGTGFQYGNYALASARQMVASGSVSPRQLALMGGVTGMAQRDIQAQAALGSMPLYGAAMGQWSPGGWGVNAGAVGQRGGGAFGMVTGAMGSLNQAVRQGGLGALATFPLAQREIQDEALSRMTPQEQMAQRFQLAMTTGQQLGLRGRGAFGAGARLLYGDEIATQMMKQAESPAFWRAQRQMIRGRQMELAMEQRAQIEEDAPGPIGMLGEAIGETPQGRMFSEAGRILRGRSPFARLGEDISNMVSDAMAPEGVIRRRLPREAAIRGERQRRGLAANEALADVQFGGRYRRTLAEQRAGATGVGTAYDIVDLMGQAANVEDQGLSGTWAAMGGEGAGAYFGGLGGFAELMQGATEIGMMRGPLGAAGGDTEMERRILSAHRRQQGAVDAVRFARERGSTERGRQQAEAAAEKVIGGGRGHRALALAGERMAEDLKSKGRTGFWRSLFSPEAVKERALAMKKGDIGGALTWQYKKRLTDTELDKYAVTALAQSNNMSEDEAREMFNGLSPTEKNAIRGRMIQQAERSGGAEVKEFFQEQAEAGAEYTAKNRQRALDMTMEAMGEELDIYETAFGVEYKTLFGQWEAAGAEDFKAQIQDQSIMESMMLTAAAGGMDRYDEAKKIFMQAGGSEKAFKQQWESAQAQLEGMDEDVREMYKGMGRAGLNAAVAYAGKSKRMALEGAIRGEEFLGELRQFAGADFAKVATSRGAVDLQKLAKTISPEGLEQMRKGGKRGRGFARAVEQAQAGDTGALQRLAVAMAPEGEVAEEAAVPAEGEEAERLGRADEAMGDMQVVFADFKVASKDFMMGTRMLREAMNSDMIRRMRED